MAIKRRKRWGLSADDIMRIIKDSTNCPCGKPSVVKGFCKKCYSHNYYLEHDDKYLTHTNHKAIKIGIVSQRNGFIETAKALIRQYNPPRSAISYKDSLSIRIKEVEAIPQKKRSPTMCERLKGWKAVAALEQVISPEFFDEVRKKNECNKGS
jgi:hypothetical protein